MVKVSWLIIIYNLLNGWNFKGYKVLVSDLGRGILKIYSWLISNII